MMETTLTEIKAVASVQGDFVCGKQEQMKDSIAGDRPLSQPGRWAQMTWKNNLGLYKKHLTNGGKLCPKY